MTPGARVAAAIECLDLILGGEAAEKVLTRWARASRFAGSGDRRAIRDHVFTALRQRRSAAWVGGGDTGRALMIGVHRLAGLDPASVFTGLGHAPSPLAEAEGEAPAIGEAPDAVRLDWPDWLMQEAGRSLGTDRDRVLDRLRYRARVTLRANTLKTDAAQVSLRLADDNISAQPIDLSPTALHVTAGEGRIKVSSAYNNGLVELQDAASQAICDQIAQTVSAQTILDACAGGGGKSLALAAHFPRAALTAHDAHPARMADLETRAARAGARITMTEDPRGVFDLVLCDVPCSGSGAWSRAPEAKWRLDADALDQLVILQAQILDRFQAHVAPTGTLAYVTCSLLQRENADQIERFLDRHSDWRQASAHRWTPLDGGDGFFLTFLTRK